MNTGAELGQHFWANSQLQKIPKI